MTFSKLFLRHPHPGVLAKRCHNSCLSRLKSSKAKSDEVPQVYVDGSSVMSPLGFRVGGAGVFWGDGDSRNASHPLLSTFDEEGREIEVTCMRAELIAAFLAIKDARERGYKRLTVHSDSEVVVMGMNSWIKAWMRDDWKKSDGGTVLNRRLFLLLWVACKQMDSVGWCHVRGHAGYHGNVEADRLAQEGSKLALNKLQMGDVPNISVEVVDGVTEDEDYVSDEFIDDDAMMEILDSQLAK